MRKTVVVRVDVLRQHPKYGKHYRASKKFKAHDEKGEYQTGDIIIIQETRPLSKEKRWEAVKLLKRDMTMDEIEDKAPDASLH